MCVVLERQAVVPDIVGAVAGLRHCPERQHFYGIVLRSILGPGEETVELTGYFLSVLGRSHLIAEIMYEGAESLELFPVGLVMDTVDKCLCPGFGGSLGRFLRRYAQIAQACSGNRRIAAALCDKLRHASVGKEHELLDEPVGLLADFLVDTDRTAFFIHLHFHFRAVEADGP